LIACCNSFGNTGCVSAAQKLEAAAAAGTISDSMLETTCQGNLNILVSALPEWSMGSMVEALRALRGIDLISAVTFVAHIGDLSRFETPRQLMAYLGLVPSEHSSGGHTRRGGITKTGNNEARRTLIESAWSYRYPARVATVEPCKPARRRWKGRPS
jgi:transposase